MTKKKKNLLEQDATLRLIYAFNYFTGLNDAWELDSCTTEQNRMIHNNMGLVMDDAYFVFGNRFYSFNYQKSSEDIITCEIKEYDNFYDLSTSMITMKFEYSSSNKSINILSDIVKKTIKTNDNYQKRMKAA